MNPNRQTSLAGWLYAALVAVLYICLATMWVDEAGRPDIVRPLPPTDVTVTQP